MSKYLNGSRGSTIPPKISGLRATLQRRSKRERAELAAAILRGETELGRLTHVQVARICGVSAQYVHAVQRANTPVVQLVAAE
jgi:hypothetical protein